MKLIAGGLGLKSTGKSNILSNQRRLTNETSNTTKIKLHRCLTSPRLSRKFGKVLWPSIRKMTLHTRIHINFRIWKS